jgi:transposase-like protein
MEPKTLQAAIVHFADYENCRQFMVAVRWLDGVVRCPHCGSDKTTYLQKARVYKCKTPHKQQKFSLKTGTVFEDSPIALEKWLPALWMLVNDKNGISSYELHRAIGVTQKSAWFMLHRIRTAISTKSFEKLGGGGPVEIDETFVGGKVANMHKAKKAKMAEIRGKQLKGDHMNKTIVMGMLDRDLRQVRAKVIPNVRRDTLQSEILREVQPGSKVYTDEWIGYNAVRQEFVHDVVNHVSQYVNGNVHTNGIENFWALLKRSLKGTYVAVEPYHLQKYVDEQIFRFDNRSTKQNPLNDSDRFMLAASQIVGKRLTYTALTGKEEETKF